MSSVSEPAVAQPGNPELPTVSAVIPAYNAADTIERALNSVYAQTYENIIEVIVVDDGSTDDTAQIVRDKFPDVILIQQENAGSPTARNRGVEEASGDYIAFLDDDDEWFPEKTEVQMMCFRERPGLRMTIAHSLTGVEGKPSPKPHTLSEVVVQQIVFCEAFPIVPFHYGCSGWMFDAELFREVGGFRLDMRRSQDTEWLWRALFQGHAAAYVAVPLYCYYYGNQRRSPSDAAKTLAAWYDLLRPVVYEFATHAVDAPAWLTAREADVKKALFHKDAAWRLWTVGERERARESLQLMVALLEKHDKTTWRERFAACRPEIHYRVARLLGR